MLDFSPALALTGLKTRAHIDGVLKIPSQYRRILKTRRYEDSNKRVYETCNCKYGFLTCHISSMFNKPVVNKIG